MSTFVSGSGSSTGSCRAWTLTIVTVRQWQTQSSTCPYEKRWGHLFRRLTRPMSHGGPRVLAMLFRDAPQRMGPISPVAPKRIMMASAVTMPEHSGSLEGVCGGLQGLHRHPRNLSMLALLWKDAGATEVHYSTGRDGSGTSWTMVRQPGARCHPTIVGFNRGRDCGWRPDGLSSSA